MRTHSGNGTARPVVKLTRDAIARRMQREARQRLGMSAAEMVSAYRAGRLDDPGRVADLLALAHLLAEDDPLFVAV